MKFQGLSVAAMASAAAAQSLNETLTSNAGVLSNLTTFIGQFPNLLSQLNNATNITILAPSNEAFTKFLASPDASRIASDTNLVQAILQYHVLNGTYSAANITNSTKFIRTLLDGPAYSNVTGGQRVGAAVVNGKATFYSGLLHESEVTRPDVNFTGGTIHVINSLLSIPQNITATAWQANLTSLYGALRDSQLAKTVDELRDVTVFAPSNEAFQSIGSALKDLNTTAIQDILKYHVVQGTVGYSNLLANGTSFKTLNGGNVTIHVRNGTIYANNARVTTSNVLVSNGVVHVIDNVLNPARTNATADPNATSGTPAFPDATRVPEIPYTSGVPTATNVPTATGPPASPPTSTTSNPAMPMKTGSIAQALFMGGAAAFLMQF